MHLFQVVSEARLCSKSLSAELALRSSIGTFTPSSMLAHEAEEERDAAPLTLPHLSEVEGADVLPERQAGYVGSVALVAGEVLHLEVDKVAVVVEVSHLFSTVGTFLPYIQMNSRNMDPSMSRVPKLLRTEGAGEVSSSAVHVAPMGDQISHLLLAHITPVSCSLVHGRYVLPLVSCAHKGGGTARDVAGNSLGAVDNRHMLRQFLYLRRAHGTGLQLAGVRFRLVDAQVFGRSEKLLADVAAMDAALVVDLLLVPLQVFYPRSADSAGGEAEVHLMLKPQVSFESCLVDGHVMAVLLWAEVAQHEAVQRPECRLSQLAPGRLRVHVLLVFIQIKAELFTLRTPLHALLIFGVL